VYSIENAENLKLRQFPDSPLEPENRFRRNAPCLDYVIPVNENHLKRILGEFIIHYNQARPHSALWPGIPEPPPEQIPKTTRRHRLPAGSRVRAKPVLRLPEWRKGLFAEHRVLRIPDIKDHHGEWRQVEH